MGNFLQIKSNVFNLVYFTKRKELHCRSFFFFFLDKAKFVLPFCPIQIRCFSLLFLVFLLWSITFTGKVKKMFAVLLHILCYLKKQTFKFNWRLHSFYIIHIISQTRLKPRLALHWHILKYISIIVLSKDANVFFFLRHFYKKCPDWTKA